MSKPLKHIYLDWNVIQYMKRAKQEDEGLRSRAALFILNQQKYPMPFSHAHIEDIASVYLPDSNKIINEDIIAQDLEYLDKISRGFAIGESENSTPPVGLCKPDNINIWDIFNDTKEKFKHAQPQPHTNYNVVGEDIKIDLNSLDSKKMLTPYIQKSGGKLTPEVMMEFIVDCSKEINDPKFFKRFTNEIIVIHSEFKKNNTIIDQQSELFKNFISPLVDFIKTDKPEKFINSFDDVMKGNLSTTDIKLEQLSLHNKIQRACFLLHFNQKFREKISDKNRPTNMLTDANHLYYALGSKYFITEDKTMFEKATFLNKALKLDIKVISMEDFYNEFK